MIYYLLAIVIILLLSVVAVFYVENNESFQELFIIQVILILIHIPIILVV